MAKKTAVVDIKLTGLDSIQELENLLVQINEQLKSINQNTAAFETLTQKADEAQAKIDELNGKLENVGGGDTAAGVEDTGKKIVEAFEDGSKATEEFSDVAAESMENVGNSVGNVVEDLGNMDESAQQMVRGVVQGMTRAAKATGLVGKQAKIAGATIKTSLLTSGVGAFLLLLSMIIGNWDKITAAIKKTRKEKELLEKQKGLQEEVDYLKAITDEYEKQAEAIKKINDSQGESEKNAEVDLELAGKKKTELEAQQKLLQNMRQIEEERAKKDEEKFDKAIKSQDSWVKWSLKVLAFGDKAALYEAQRLAKLAEQATASERQLNISKQQEETNEANLKLLEEQARIAQNMINQKPYADRVKAIDDEISALKDSNEILDAQGNKSQAIYANNKKIVGLEREKLAIQSNLTDMSTEEYNRTQKTFAAQGKALDIQNQKRLEAIKKETEALDIERARNMAGDAYLTTLKNEEIFLNTSLSDDRKREEILQHRLAMTEKELALNDYKTQQQIKMFPFDKKGLEILKNTLGLRSDELKLLEEFEGIEVNVSKLSLTRKLEYANELQQLRDIAKARIDILNSQQEGLDNSKYHLYAIAKQNMMLAGQANAYAEVAEEDAQAIADSLEGIKNEEVILEKKREIAALEKEAAGYRNEAAGYTQAWLQANYESKDIVTQQLAIDNQIAEIQQDTLNSEQQITYELEQQVRLSERLKGFLADYQEEIAATQELLSASFEFVASLYDRAAEEAARKMKDLEKQLKKLEKREDKIKELKEELKDADGERYDNLLALIAEEEAAELNKNQTIEEQRLAIEAAMKEAENKKMEAEYQAAKWRKVQAIVDATIAGALAVVNALPNVVLAAIVGVLSAVGIATIAAQKLPERPPKQAYGGFMDGRSHAQGGIPVEVEGGEYIVNKRSTSRYLPLLEAINSDGNRRKFADGGTTAPVSTGMQSELIDYERLASAILTSIQPTVAVVDINRGQQRVKVIENNAKI